MKWPKNLTEARRIQEVIREKVRIVPAGKAPRLIAGVDAAFSGGRVFAAASLYRYPEMVHVKDAHAVRGASFPYIPGFLFFREGPAIIDAIKALGVRPDLILSDGQGIAHPEGAGLASHLGVLLDIPTIGCAKSRLVGEYEEPGSKRGQWSPLRYDGRVVGAVVRTRDNIKPLFVSPGHRVTLKDAVRYVLGCAPRYRIPEPLRRADHLSKDLKGRFIA